MWCEDLENDYEFAGWYNSYKKHNAWKKQIDNYLLTVA